MIQNRLLIPIALLLPALLASHVPGDRIRFAPSEASSATKTFENQAEFSLDNISIRINGGDSPMKPEMEMSINSTQKVVVTDEYLANRDGAPKQLRRSFDELANDVAVAVKIEMIGQTQNNDHTIKGESELQGKKVVFTWDEDKGEYVKAFDPAADKDALLKDLEEDMDLRALLPKGEVKEGEEWDIDVKDLATVLAPGGNLSILPKEMDAEDMSMGMPGMTCSLVFMRSSLSRQGRGTPARTGRGSETARGRVLPRSYARPHLHRVTSPEDPAVDGPHGSGTRAGLRRARRPLLRG